MTGTRARGQREIASLTQAPEQMPDTEARLDYLRDLFMRAPTNIAVFWGPNQVCVLANSGFRQAVGDRNLIDRPVREALTEREGQVYFDLLDRVYASGESVTGNEVPTLIDRRGDGNLDEAFFNVVMQPLRDAAGAVEGVIVHSVDVTELVLARRQVEQLRAEHATILGHEAQLLASEHEARRRAETRLRESEERFRAITETAPDAIITIDDASQMVSINPATERVFGYTREEMLGHPITMLMPEHLRQRHLAGFGRYLATGTKRVPWTGIELVGLRKDGTVVPLEVSFAEVDQNGKRLFTGFVRDITRRKQTEEALRETDAQFRTVYDGAPIGIAIIDLDRRFVETNRALQELFGYSADELRGMTFTEITQPDDAIAYGQLARELLEGRRDHYQIEKRYVRKGGQVAWTNISASLVREADGRPQFAIKMIEDITARKQAEEELRAHVHQQAAVAEIGQYALASNDLSAVFEEAVTIVAQTLEVEHSKVLELLPDGNWLLLRAGVGWREGLMGTAMVGAGTDSQAGYTLLSQRPVIVQDLRTDKRFGGPPLLVEHGVVSGMSVVIQGKDRPFGVLGTHTKRRRTFTHDDVHFLQAVAHVLAAAIERKRAEEERTRHSRELAMRVLQAQEEERKRIARGLHDETVQSLSTLLINLDLLEPHVPLQPNAHASGFERVRSIARSALDDARTLAYTLRPPILDDLGLVAGLQGLAAEYTQTCGIPVEVVAEPMVGERLLPQVELALFRVAQEALTNACKHAEAGWVHVRISISDGAVELEVEDNGKGFDLDQVVHPTRQGGLGLYGMRERAALLDGRLTIDAAPGKGTRIVLVVPMQGTQTQTTADHERIVEEDAQVETDVRVLLVDDHAMFREGLRLVLDAQPEIAVVGEADDGRQALEMVGQLHPDVVVMDVGMPRLNGVDATLQIKRRFPDVKVVILTTHESREYLVQIVKVDAAGYALKRSAGTELVEAVKAVAQGKSYISPTIAGMMLDDYRMRIDRGGEDLLTEREREVLQLVAEGLTNQAIARQLVISVKTVQSHRDSIMEKLGAHDRTDLVKYAIRTGMITPG